MILFPRPRIPFVIAVVAAIPTWGMSLAVFYFLFKRPYDSAGLSLILGAAKRSLESRRVAQGPELVNRAAIERVFSKFGDQTVALRVGEGVPFVRWGVVRHPMLNGEEPFTLRVDRLLGTVHVEAAPGVAWWLLTDRVWLGRQGTVPGLPVNLSIRANAEDEDKFFSDHHNAAVCMMIMALAHDNGNVELSSLRYEEISEFASVHKLGAEWYENYAGMRFFVAINSSEYVVHVKNLEPEKQDDGAVSMQASRLPKHAPVTVDIDGEDDIPF